MSFKIKHGRLTLSGIVRSKAKGNKYLRHSIKYITKDIK